MNEAAEASAFPTPAVAWRSAIIIFVITAIAMADRMSIAMLIGPIKQDFGIGDFQASLLIGAAFTSFYILFLLPIGWAADRFSRRKVLAVCLLIWSIATLACGWATGFVTLFGLRMLMGAGEAGMAPCCHGIIGDSFPRKSLAKPLALQGIGFQVGSAVGVAAAGAVLAAGSAGAISAWPVIGHLAPWRVALIMIGIPGLLALGLILLLHDPRQSQRRVRLPSKEALMPFLRQNAATVTMAMMFGGASAIGLGCVTSWIPEYVQRVHGVPPFRTGATLGTLLLLAAFAGQGLYAIITDWLTARGVKDAVLRVGLAPIALSIPLAWATFESETPESFFGWLTALLLCIAPGNAITNTTIQLLAPPALRSRMAAIGVLTVSVVGFTLGPSLVGWLSQYVLGEAHLGMALQWVLAGAMTTALILLWVLRPRLLAHLRD